MDRGPAGGPPERHLASSVSTILASGEGWCQTLFLVLTCRLRNQKQSLTPSRQKSRFGGEGFVLGFLFGPLGVIVEAALPTVSKPSS